MAAASQPASYRRGKCRRTTAQLPSPSGTGLGPPLRLTLL